MKSNLSALSNHSKKEISPNRDGKFAKRHRMYGRNNYQYDLDHLWFSGSAEPVCALEEKSPYTKEIDLDNFQFRCLRNEVAERYPFFLIVPYFIDTAGDVMKPEYSLSEEGYDTFLRNIQYLMVPCNKQACKYQNSIKMLSEREMIWLESKIRGLEVDQDILNAAYQDVEPVHLMPEIKNVGWNHSNQR